MIEGFLDKKTGKYLFDFYSMKYDKRQGKSYGYKVYCQQVYVTTMFKNVSSHMAFMKQLLNGKEAL
ncbi:hypothetical protein BCR25_05555 [Enterococcus termitis]|uniref:Uncharacterized protein n=1 Tax=Enterococcus termitis TaxID=332950 RepID=A0A1E5GK35_9ENTE|nr:hypothetical protein BCR25_05555 [Enterococcus termitis]